MYLGSCSSLLHGGPGRSTRPPGGTLPPVCTFGPPDRQLWHIPEPEHLAKGPEPGLREVEDQELCAGWLAPPPLSGLEPGEHLSHPQCMPAQVTHMPGPGFLYPGTSRLWPYSSFSKFQALSPVPHCDVSLRGPAVSMSFPFATVPPSSQKVQLSFPHFNAHLFLLSNYEGWHGLLDMSAFFFSPFIADFRAFWGKN